MPNHTGTFFLLILTVLSITDGRDNRKPQTEKPFIEYIEKYDPKNVWDRIDKEQKLTGKLSDVEYVDAMFYGIDVTDQLLEIKVQNGDARIPIHDTRRKHYIHAPGLNIYLKDKFNLRPRLYELMKQAIYQARNKMIIMQNYREKYRNSSLYKMGFLMSKTDNACKTFSKFSYRAYKICHLSRQRSIQRVYLYDIVSCEERLINLWFQVDLLIDVLEKNDIICKKVINDYTSKRLQMWKFED